MSAAENKQLMQHIFDELGQGNSRPLVESMADDFCWTVTGSTKWSRTYKGKEAVLGELFATLRSRMADRIRTIAERFIAEDDVVVVEARGNNTTKNGKPYNNRYCFVFRLANGKLQEVTEYMDTLLVATTLE
ncbi:MAG TPA: nuclear transport factor 2 family protein [Candidatus Angelobacter sp.]|nr:nuclear transport factor 2 family protein [Candidatus Angelobacter sp.]